jgi:hypothetical protein
MDGKSILVLLNTRGVQHVQYDPIIYFHITT